MKQKISTHQLEHLMPHRYQMIWVDDVLSYESDEGQVSVTLKKEYPYFSNDRLMTSFFLEFMAQGYGFYRAAQVLDQNLDGLDKAMIPMISKYEFKDQTYLAGDIITAKLKTIKELGDLFFVQGECFDKDGQSIAYAEFKVYAKASL